MAYSNSSIQQDQKWRGDLHAASNLVLHHYTSDSVLASGSKEYFLLDTGSTQSYLKVPELVQALISGEGNDTQYGKILSLHVITI